MKSLLFHIAIVFSAVSVQAQNNGFFNVPNHPIQKNIWEDGSSLHLNLQPFIPGFDTSYYAIQGGYESPSFIKTKPKNPGQAYQITPILEFNGGYQFRDSSQSVYSAIGGLQFNWHIDNDWYAQIQAAGLQLRNPEYLQVYQETANITPGLGYTNNGEFGSSGVYLAGKVGYNAPKFFSFELGNDKNFWGEGYRSLILSQNTASYPYLKITTDVWKVRYVNIWAQMRDISRGERWADARKKYTSIHALSWNFNRKWNLTLYEMVIWQAEDTLSDRGLDLNYLNPVIFYRPVEFSLGSADNEIVGLNLSFRPNDKTQVYSQVLLDEFLFRELVDRTGWWANKFGVQFGVKAYDVLTQNLNLQTEINYVRPFTYTHGSVLQNWGHLNQSMAHPLGTNFVEWVNHISFQKNDWLFSNEFIWAIYGRDRDGDNYGGDLFRSYKGPLKTYDNYIAQGLKSTLHYNEFTVLRKLNSNIPVQFRLSYIWRYESNEFNKSIDHVLTLGIVANTISRYRDF